MSRLRVTFVGARFILAYLSIHLQISLDLYQSFARYFTFAQQFEKRVMHAHLKLPLKLALGGATL